MDDPTITRARAAVRAEADTRTAHEAAIDDRNDAVRAAFDAHPDLGPTDLGRALGLTDSTVRGITRDLADARRRRARRSGG